MSAKAAVRSARAALDTIDLPLDADIKTYFNSFPTKRTEALLMQLVRNTAPATAATTDAPAAEPKPVVAPVAS